ncbi:retron-type reverse transcriptase [Rhizobium sp. BK077]|uniref:retron Ec67 family RNA-directed DNA polymerase/endonuclease n=1 Tax=unclassified Rhizobium TaxID=2613769 RepID=UPI0016152563|nr:MULTISPECIES: retron Ec67 family RNA-directed DNA polymerase/endonuclease [unclassified Rhizobium]MBB3303082.1 retron-type reverse transcriptase [Rhizobium sp. BK112]MBB3371975.1 retron-type reverse transcriptase [Rhizobium sp. BK077]MBB4182941.1 retron-type reverse transcriptase [Rhizobium sp. BK109]
MSELSNLKAAKTLPQLARLLNLNGETLSYALYWYRRSAPYTYFTVAKKSGGRRAIAAPNSRLKLVQSRLGQLLARIETDMELKRTTKSRVLSHGFKAGFSIVTNAKHHRNKRWVFNVDLKEFFPSINFGRVYGFFLKDRNFELDPKIATIIAQIACHDNKLPQGSPCSPVISNLIAHILDIKLNKLANDLHCTYTRYADDLTFSTNEKHFPEAIARLVRGSDDKWVAGDGLLNLIYRAGFQLNHEKTRMQHRDSRQDATGLVVNQKVNVRHEYYKQARAMCHHLFTNGYAYSRTEFAPVSNDAVEGMMNFIYQIRAVRSPDFTATDPRGFFKSDQPGFSELYGRLLNYCSFYGMLRPTIICEGKTDNIYLLAAIKQLAAKFPQLIDPAQKVPMKVQFFNYSERTALFQGLSGGGDEMYKLMKEFRERMRFFKHGPSKPVIMVVDNDDASKGIFSYIGTVMGTGPVSGLDPFYYVFENLYVVPVPKVAGTSAIIEDLFDAAVKKPINGRIFNSSNKKFDLTKYYGKNELATKIVAPERSSIDFTKFEPMLQSFADIIMDYGARLAAKPAMVPVKNAVAGP